MGVEPTGDRIACHPPVLKTGTITGPHALPLTGYLNPQTKWARALTRALTFAEMANFTSTSAVVPFSDKASPF